MENIMRLETRRYCGNVLFDTDSYNHENEKLVKVLRSDMNHVGFKDTCLICKFVNKLINTYDKPYELKYDYEYNTMDFVFYRNSYDILSKYEMSYFVDFVVSLRKIKYSLTF